MGYGDVVYLETGTGKTYIAIMLLKYLFSDHFIDYQSRLVAEGLPVDVTDSSGQRLPHLSPIEVPVESDDQVKLFAYPEYMIEKRKEERSIKVQQWNDQDDNRIEVELKK